MELDHGCCSCFISAPCSYCTSRSECAECEEMNFEESMIPTETGYVCHKCHDKYHQTGEPVTDTEQGDN